MIPGRSAPSPSTWRGKDAGRRSDSLHEWANNFMSLVNMTVVILAAGLGTRMRSKRAKVLHRAGGLTLVENVVAAAGAVAAPDRTIAVTGHQAEEVEAALQSQNIGFVRQFGQKGTGHALAACKERLENLDG